MQLKVEKEFGVSFDIQGTRRLLTRHGLRYISPQPHHSKADIEVQQQFGDTFSKSTSNILPDGLAPK